MNPAGDTKTTLSGNEQPARGLGLAVTVCVLAGFGLVITLMPRTDPSLWGAVLAVAAVGPVGAIILIGLGAMAHKRATERSAIIVARVAIGLSVVGLISALSLWSL